jgi:hypothetical protein
MSDIGLIELIPFLLMIAAEREGAFHAAGGNGKKRRKRMRTEWAPRQKLFETKGNKGRRRNQ